MLDEFTFKVADPTEYESVFQLRRVVYRDDFNHAPDEALDEGAHQLIACNRAGEIVAAMRVIGPERRPFDIEDQIDLSRLLPTGRAIALVGGLCVQRDYRTVSSKGFLSLGMLKLAYLFACKHGLTDFLIYVYRYLRPFYRAAFFEVLVPTFEHSVWGAMCLMRLDIKSFEVLHGRSSQPFARFLFSRSDSNFVV